MDPVRKDRSLTTWMVLVISTGTVVVVWSLVALAAGSTYETPRRALQLVLLVALTLLGGYARLKVPGVAVDFSISDAFTMAAAALFGPSAGTLVVAVDALVLSLRLTRGGLAPRRVLFNATAAPLAMWLSAQALFLVAGTGTGGLAQLGPLRLGLSFVAFAAMYFALGTSLVAVGIALECKKPVTVIWRAYFLSLWPTYVVGAVAAGALAHYTLDSPLVLVPLVVALPAVLYFAFRHAMGRVDDQVRHLSDLSKLYLSVIEALAHTIDARDQVTHGHVCRVQRRVLELAREIGVTDEKELKALEVAALLHDMGKLGVPEHILNKPGRLSPAEFEKMKIHASIGADILAPIDFGYPVVPIVRHHHENWDGSGYPDHLAGNAIPLGARLLSVVDCFDALTSDRPYRRGLSEAQALAMLVERRGTGYDPDVVDALVRLQQRSPNAGEADLAPAPSALAERDRAQTSGRRPEGELPDAAVGMSALIDLGRALSTGRGDAAFRAIGTWFERVMPGSTWVVYERRSAEDEVEATVGGGLEWEMLAGRRIPVANRVTGWVVANQASVTNADAALDLEEFVHGCASPVRCCASVPLVAAGRQLGAITVYSPWEAGFLEHHSRMLEAVASAIAALVASGETTCASGVVAGRPPADACVPVGHAVS
jgi:putative nucleotidyltransferase with HDIG domain